jgi:predicted SprT family Zn-dependent metalloprotease
MKLSEIAIWTCQTLGVPHFVEMIDVDVNNRLKVTLATASSPFVDGKRTYLLSINQELWRRANDEEKRKTLIHEICHLVEFYLHGRVQNIKKGHGPIWDNYMRMCGLDPKSERFHNLECSDLRRKQHKWAAKCPCGSIKTVKTTKARRIMAGKRYRCVRCRGLVEVIMGEQNEGCS